MSAQTITTKLLDLTRAANTSTEPGTLRSLLHQGHELYYQVLEEVRADVVGQTGHLSDAEFAHLCAQAGAPWQDGTARSDALSELVWARFDTTPAAMAYQSLVDRAHRHHADLIDG